MKTHLFPWTRVLALSLLSAAGLAQAAMPLASCEAQAAEKKLAGAAKSSFVKKCQADQPLTACADACTAAAGAKKLAGAAKTSFLKKCQADGGPAQVGLPVAAAAAADDGQAACAAKAAEKKLAGAAKASFTKKCVADAAAK